MRMMTNENLPLDFLTAEMDAIGLLWESTLKLPSDWVFSVVRNEPLLNPNTPPNLLPDTFFGPPH